MTKESEVSARPPVEMRRKRRPPTVEIVASPTYDLLLSLFIVFSNPATHDFELDPTWIAKARAACPPEHLATLAFFFGDEDEAQWGAARLCGLLWQAPDPMDVSATLDWLAALPVADIYAILLERDGLGDDWLDTVRGILAMPAGGSKAKIEQHTRAISTFARRFPQGEREAVTHFLTAPEDERRRLITAVRAWYAAVFPADEARVSAVITREAASVAQRQGTLSVEALFSSAVRGIDLDLPAATERLVLAPCLLIMPTVFYFRTGETVTYCFPVTDSARVAADSALMQRQEMVRLFNALADDTRLRILKHLSERTMYLTELSEHLKLTKATTRHHMVRLRAAGLVTLHQRDHLSYYSLRRETLDEPTRTLLRYLNLT
ncbi:MAG: winged helix-turn-helix transcriptional regulator [Ktedonobacterales bacterium]|nr:winged helix-turn-helix transcriptional regulator [Ktedonobacterales bacterium]